MICTKSSNACCGKVDVAANKPISWISASIKQSSSSFRVPTPPQTMLDIDKLKQRPISVFHIPLELLNDLRPTDYNASETPSSVDLTANKLERLELEQATKEQEDGSLTCRTCNITFPPTDRQEHRAHFATDWHRYNIKRKLTLGLEPVNATDFENMLAGTFVG